MAIAACAELRGATAGLRGAEDALEQLRAMGLISVLMSLAAARRRRFPYRWHPCRQWAMDAAEPVDAVVGIGFVDAYAMLSAKMSQTVREHLGMLGYFL